MDISVQELKRVSVITVKGRVDSETASGLEASLRQLVESGKAQIVLDLKEVGYVSTAGLRAMVATLKAVKRLNGDLRLCSLTPQVADALRLAGMTPVFRIYPSQVEAVGSF